MPATCQNEGRQLCWSLEGEIDHHRAQNISQALEREISLRLPQSLELDFSRVTFMDSSGIALVLRAHRLMNERGGSLTLKAVPRQAARVLRAAGLHRLIPMETR